MDRKEKEEKSGTNRKQKHPRRIILVLGIDLFFPWCGLNKKSAHRSKNTGMEDQKLAPCFVQTFSKSWTENIYLHQFVISFSSSEAQTLFLSQRKKPFLSFFLSRIFVSIRQFRETNDNALKYYSSHRRGGKVLMFFWVGSYTI